MKWLPKIVLVILLIAALAGCTAPPKNPASKFANASKTNYGVMEGINAPDFTLPSLEKRDESLTLKQYKGKPLLVNFWASWCIPCRAEAPILEAAYQKYKDRMNFLGIAIRDNPEDSKQFVKEYKIKFPTAVDNEAKVAFEYGVNAIPATFLIDEKGEVAGLIMGTLTEKTINQELDKLLKKS